MPVKRRLSKVVDGRITSSVVVASARALELREQASRGEIDRDAAHEAEATVDRMLGGGIRRLWLPSIFDVDRAELKRRLDAALAEAKAQNAISEPEPAPA